MGNWVVMVCFHTVAHIRVLLRYHAGTFQSNTFMKKKIKHPMIFYIIGTSNTYLHY